MNYKIAFDRITRAYLNNELEPFNGCACFIGNLLNNQLNWQWGRSAFFTGKPGYKPNILASNNCIRKNADGFYTLTEIYTLEKIFLTTLHRECNSRKEYIDHYVSDFNDDGMLNKLPEYEEALYTAMCVTLEALKQLHIQKGEDVDQSLALNKRELVTI